MSDKTFDDGIEFGIETMLNLSEEDWKEERERVAARIYGATGSPLTFDRAAKPQKQTYRRLAEAALGAMGFQVVANGRA